jgi:PTH1 family peptidyl-tRNA hydrolase
MNKIIVGLGNPGEEYENTRHNTGRIFTGFLAEEAGAKEFKEDLKLKSLVSAGKLGKVKFQFVLPQTFMNNSGQPLKKLITSKKKALDLVVVHDDVDLPLGRFKISFGSSSAGHRGVESVMRAVKTKDFFRVRIGISPSTPSGKTKKPESGKKMLDFLMSNFKTAELTGLKKVFKEIISALPQSRILQKP